MATIIIDITQIQTELVQVNGKLIVQLRKKIKFYTFFATCFFITGMIFCVYHQKFSTLFTISVILFIFLYDQYAWYFPRNIPYLCIDSCGISYNKKFFYWKEIENIKYETVNPKFAILQRNFLCLVLKNKKKVVIDISYQLIDSSIRIIAAFIKKYRSEQ
ncbi:MAG: hypothetical protein ABIN97_09075 [Ginsengibacter sp.]